MMVLDGQQRLQSLLLATHGDATGFKLTDKDWAVATEAKSAKGRSNRKFWSLGSLCLDIEELLLRYNEADQQLTAVEFDKVLKWAVLDAKTGRAHSKKPDNYVEAIPLRGANEMRSRLVRFSRLWNIAGHNPAMKEKNFHEELRTLLKHHEVDASKFDQLLVPLSELMTTLRDVKLARVVFLELAPFDRSIGTAESYDDAIVSIFTRLNTAGRTLTREEITFAWLKVGWDDKKTGNRQASRCFADLLESVKAEGKTAGIGLGIDEMVGAVSFLWAVAYRKGGLLSNADLLQGEIIRPMAGDLSGVWDLIERSISEVTDVVYERKLEYGRHYSSANALAVLWTLHFLAIQQGRSFRLNTTESDALGKRLEEGLAAHLDRWLICSAWAERWARGSGTVLRAYAADLSSDSGKFAAAKNVDELVKVYVNRLEALVHGLETDAVNFVDTRLAVESRDLVRAYFTPLWIWHRCNSSRWEASKTSLLIGKAKADSLDVDHVISVKIWDGKDGKDSALQDDETKDGLVNSIGNCVLLQKSFNIAKKARSLHSFMSDVHEVQSGKIKIADWAKALGLSDAQLDGDVSTAEQAIAATRAREEAILADLRELVRGKSKRVDVA